MSVDVGASLDHPSETPVPRRPVERWRGLEAHLETATGALVAARVLGLGEGGTFLEHAPCAAVRLQLLLPGRCFPLILAVASRPEGPRAPRSSRVGYAIAWEHTDAAEEQRAVVAAFVDGHRLRAAEPRLGSSAGINRDCAPSSAR